jgi:hypothetical protein
MPSEYSCKSCKLEFTIGWFHYHIFDSGFAAQTDLVCKACGCCHTIKHAISESNPDELFAQSGPSFAKPLDYNQWLSYKTAVELRPNRAQVEYVSLIGVSDKLNLTEVACAFCQEKSTLIAEWPENDCQCPSCKQTTLEFTDCWMT